MDSFATTHQGKKTCYFWYNSTEVDEGKVLDIKTRHPNLTGQENIHKIRRKQAEVSPKKKLNGSYKKVLCNKIDSKLSVLIIVSHIA